MVIYVAVGCKVILHKGGLKFLYTSKGRKFETAMAHKNKNIEISRRCNMPECVMLIASA